MKEEHEKASPAMPVDPIDGFMEQLTALASAHEHYVAEDYAKDCKASATECMLPGYARLSEEMANTAYRLAVPDPESDSEPRCLVDPYDDREIVPFAPTRAELMALAYQYLKRYYDQLDWCEMYMSGGTSEMRNPWPRFVEITRAISPDRPIPELREYVEKRKAQSARIRAWAQKLAEEVTTVVQ